MTDREKLLAFLNGDNKLDSIEEILKRYLYVCYDDVSALQLSEMMADINNALREKVRELNRTRRIANERARYLKNYLSGNMWTTEEAARANLQPQIDNAQAIIDACNNKYEF